MPEASDAEEDARYGKDDRGDELPAELARRQTRIKRPMKWLPSNTILLASNPLGVNGAQ